jgi:hypothetical protein
MSEKLWLAAALNNRSQLVPLSLPPDNTEISAKLISNKSDVD